MAYALISAAVGLALFALYVLQHQRNRDLVARARGGGVAIKHYPREPFSGFDFQMAIHMDIPLLHRHHQCYGRTFIVNSLLSQPSIATIASENIHAVNSEKNWGIEPLRLAGKLFELAHLGLCLVQAHLRYDSRNTRSI